MASLLSSTGTVPLQHKISYSSFNTKPTLGISQTIARNGRFHGLKTNANMSVEGNVIEKESASLNEKIGLQINEARPHDKLPYRGAWLWVGSEMIHLMELPNPDPLTGRPEHGGRDRHTCIAIRDVSKLKAILDSAGIPYTLSKSGRPAIFTRDPDANALEFTQIDA